MNHANRTPSSVLARVIAALCLAGFLLFLGTSLMTAGASRAPFPFLWRDIALAHALVAIPLAWVLARLLHRRLEAVAAAIVAGSLLALSLLPALDTGRGVLTDLVRTSVWPGLALRSATALTIVMSMILLTMILLSATRDQSERLIKGGLLLGLLLLFIVPWSYLAARCRHDRANLAQHLEQMRLGEAQALAHTMLLLDPDQTCNARPLTEVAAELDQQVRTLESAVRRPRGARESPLERLERARLLAMLGRTDSALDALVAVSHEPALTRHAYILRGTICEAREDWPSALDAFQHARKAWESQPSSTARTDGIVRATTGIAYSQRKMGRYAEAETTYLEVLALSPSADSHFLLAQFYEDAQHGAKAREHARSAMQLAPDRFHSAGERLIGKLMTSHFSCLGVFASEQDAR